MRRLTAIAGTPLRCWGNTVQLIFDGDEIEKTKITEPEIKETFELGNGMPDSKLVPNRYVPEEELLGFRAFHERWVC